MPWMDGNIYIAAEIDGEINVIEIVEERTRETYAGAISITPSQQTQKFLTAGMIVDTDLTVQPIPQNYGLITTDGFGIRIT